MSFEHSKLKRIDILNHLENNRNNIRPPDDRYKDEYVNFVCEQLGIEQSEVHYEVLIDISKIKSFYKACGYDFQKMKNKHKKFFNACVKSKRLATSPPSTPPVQSPPEVVQPAQNVDEEYEKVKWTKNRAGGDVAMHRGYWYVLKK